MYCVAKGEAPSNFQGTPTCSTTVDTIYRLPLLEHHRGDVEVETKCRVENPVRVVRYRHKISFSELVSRVHPAPVCASGTEIGTLSPGGQLQWLVNPGPITLTVLTFYADGKMPGLRSQSFSIASGKTYELSWHASLTSAGIALDSERQGLR